MKQTAITLLTLLLLTSLASASLLRITDTGSPPRLQFNMLQYPVSPLNRDAENFGIGLPFPYPDEMDLPCRYYPPCPRAITFDYPQCQSAGASHVNVYIDGATFINNTGTRENRLRYYTVPGYPQLLSGSPGPDTIWTKWLINSPSYPYQIELNEWNWIDFVDRGDSAYPAVYFQFKMINLDTLPHSVGVMLNLDLKLGNRLWCTDCSGGCDDPPFQVGGIPSLVRHTRAFGLSATPPTPMPAFYQAYERGPMWPESSQVVLFADLIAPGLTAPDFFGVGNDTIRSYSWYSDWNPRDTSMITDANSMVGWGPVTLAPEGEITWVTRVGLGPSAGHLDARKIRVDEISVPDMWFDRCPVAPETLVFDYQLVNTDTVFDAFGVGARLEFLERAGCFTFVTPSTFMLSPDSLTPFAYSPVTWRVLWDATGCILPPVDSIRIPVRVISIVSTPGFATDTAYDTITVHWNDLVNPVVTPLAAEGLRRSTCDSECVTWVISHSCPIPVDSIHLYLNDVRQSLTPGDSAEWLDVVGPDDTLRVCLAHPASDTALVELRQFHDIYGSTEDPFRGHQVRLHWDNLPPIVVSVIPRDGAVSSDPLRPVIFTLQDSLWGHSVSSATIDLESIAIEYMGTVLRFGDPNVEWDSAASQLIIRPWSPFTCSTVVNVGIFEMTDRPTSPGCAANRMVTPFRSSFTVVVDGYGSVETGWNLIAQSREPRWGPDPMPLGIASGFWTYSPAGYATAESLDLGQGAWVLATESVNLPYIGCWTDSVTFEVLPGWNLIGGVSLTVPLSEMVVDPPGTVIAVYSYDNAVGAYELETSRIEPGKGYWMLATDSARVTIHR